MAIYLQQCCYSRTWVDAEGSQQCINTTLQHIFIADSRCPTLMQGKCRIDDTGIFADHLVFVSSCAIHGRIVLGKVDIQQN